MLEKSSIPAIIVLSSIKNTHPTQKSFRPMLLVGTILCHKKGEKLKKTLSYKICYKKQHSIKWL